MLWAEKVLSDGFRIIHMVNNMDYLFDAEEAIPQYGGARRHAAHPLSVERRQEPDVEDRPEHARSGSGPSNLLPVQPGAEPRSS